MSSFLWFLTQIVLAQALGVGLAWGVDALSWEMRREQQEPVDSLSIGVLALSLPIIVVSALSLLLDLKLGGFGSKLLFIPIPLWLLLVTWVQKRQRGTSWRTTFFGAMMQFVCFAMALFLGGLVNLLLGGFTFDLVWLASAALCHALLSLCRPTIYGAWNTWRQTSGKP